MRPAEKGRHLYLSAKTARLSKKAPSLPFSLRASGGEFHDVYAIQAPKIALNPPLARPFLGVGKI
jgi:hypothetical protein